MRQTLLALSFLCAACGSTGQPELSYPVTARGEAPAPFMVGAWQVTLSRAEVAFGPAYFCATAAASSDLCRAAVSEVARTVAINALDPNAQSLGDAYGTTGSVRSVTYDLGISWFNTQRSPRAGDAAPEGHSAVFAGQAVQGTRTLQFTAHVDVLPKFQGTRTIQGAPVSADLQPGIALELSLNPSAWFSRIDFDALAATAVGDAVEISPASTVGDRLVTAMTVTAPLRMTWTQSEQ